MGKINVQGVGVLEIEGNEPNANEIEKIKSLINDKQTMLHQNIQAPTGEDIENSFNFKRFLLEAGLSIGGALATGGAALPAIAARQGGMLAKPFLAQLAKSAGGSAIGGGTGAGLAQTFDPREDILQEIARGAVEGATAEIIGAPIAVKGAQYLNKYLIPIKPAQIEAIKIIDSNNFWLTSESEDKENPRLFRLKLNSN